MRNFFEHFLNGLTSLDFSRADVLSAVGVIVAFLVGIITVRAMRRQSQAATKDAMEARLLAVRPHLLLEPQDFGYIHLLWEAGKRPSFAYMRHGKHTEFSEDPPIFSLRNIGTGPALNINVEWRHGSWDTENSPMTESQFESLKALFERGSIKFERHPAGPIKITDLKLRQNPNRLLQAYAERIVFEHRSKEAIHRDSIPACAVGQEVTFKMPESPLFTAVLRGLVQKLRTGLFINGVYDLVEITFNSTANQLQRIECFCWIAEAQVSLSNGSDPVEFTEAWTDVAALIRLELRSPPPFR